MPAMHSPAHRPVRTTAPLPGLMLALFALAALYHLTAAGFLVLEAQFGAIRRLAQRVEKVGDGRVIECDVPVFPDSGKNEIERRSKRFSSSWIAAVYAQNLICFKSYFPPPPMVTTTPKLSFTLFSCKLAPD